MLNGEKRRVYLKAKMWGGREEGNVYLNQSLFAPYSKSLRAAQILWTLFFF